jgi:hypothetical protein
MERRPAASGSGVLTRQKGVGDESVVEAPILIISPETGGCGLISLIRRSDSEGGGEETPG